MTIDNEIAFLERVPALRRLGRPALRILAIGAESLRVESGKVLFAAGDDADGAYLVQEGSFNLTPANGDREEVVGTGAFLGELALLATTEWPATVTARENAVVMRISRAMFLKMLEGYPDAANRLRDVLADRVDQYTRELDSIRDALARGDEPPSSGQ